MKHRLSFVFAGVAAGIFLLLLITPAFAANITIRGN